MKHFNPTIYLTMYNNVYTYSVGRDFVKVKIELELLKQYLNDCKMYMPEQIYPYKKDDITTWRYLPRPSSSDYASCDKKGWTMLNREWKYA